jgi:hypothetical protein
MQAAWKVIALDSTLQMEDALLLHQLMMVRSMQVGMLL